MSEQMIRLETARMWVDAVLTTAERYRVARTPYEDLNPSAPASAFRPARFEQHYLAVALHQLCLALDEGGLTNLLALIPDEAIRFLRNAFEHGDDLARYINGLGVSHLGSVAAQGKLGYLGALHLDPLVDAIDGFADILDARLADG